ncbi:MAG: hypothetical protein JOZ96_10395 [Acidobacteria bacterium]|nr:hypothetical protein [Acidobacteriota bacterium]
MNPRVPAVGLAVCCLSLTLCAGVARAQGETPAFDAARVPAEGAGEKAFVPAGWKVGGRAGGDLDGDGRADAALWLVPKDYDTEGVNAAPESQALLVLLSSEGGRLRRGGLATKLLVPVVPQYILNLSVKNGVLVVNQNYGMTDVLDVTDRFRYDPAAGRFVLIGRDAFNYHRPQGPDWPAVKVSENYLTGVRLTTEERWRGQRPLKPSEKREQIARTRTFLEDVDEDHDN